MNLPFLKKETLFEKQIAVFNAAQMKRGVANGHYMFWLRKFAERYHRDAFDITEEDIDDFLVDVSALYDGDTVLGNARTAVMQLKRFYNVRNRSLAKGGPARYNTVNYGRP